MRVKLIAVVTAVVLLAAAYLIGYWPQRSQRLAADSRAETLQTALALAEARVRAGELLGRVLTVVDLVERQDYGHAIERSSVLFDGIRQEAAATPDSALRDGLNAALGKRDVVTSGLAKGNPATAETLRATGLDLRRALAYELPPAPRTAP
jgi:hypothetical protein